VCKYSSEIDGLMSNIFSLIFLGFIFWVFHYIYSTVKSSKFAKRFPKLTEDLPKLIDTWAGVCLHSANLEFSEDEKED